MEKKREPKGRGSSYIHDICVSLDENPLNLSCPYILSSVVFGMTPAKGIDIDFTTL